MRLDDGREPVQSETERGGTLLTHRSDPDLEVSGHV